jgi:hypothetical protein
MDVNSRAIDKRERLKWESTAVHVVACIVLYRQFSLYNDFMREEDWKDWPEHRLDSQLEEYMNRAHTYYVLPGRKIAFRSKDVSAIDTNNGVLVQGMWLPFHPDFDINDAADFELFVLTVFRQIARRLLPKNPGQKRELRLTLREENLRPSGLNLVFEHYIGRTCLWYEVSGRQIVLRLKDISVIDSHRGILVQGIWFPLPPEIDPDDMADFAYLVGTAYHQNLEDVEPAKVWRERAQKLIQQLPPCRSKTDDAP